VEPKPKAVPKSAEKNLVKKNHQESPWGEKTGLLTRLPLFDLLQLGSGRLRLAVQMHTEPANKTSSY
jgi:hypothetical protein